MKQQNEIRIRNQIDSVLNATFPSIKEFNENNQLGKMVGKITEICDYEDCMFLSKYRFEGKNYCFFHSTESMKINENYCRHENCLILASFNYDSKKTGKYCISHRKEGMINVHSPKCVVEGCDKIANFRTINGDRYCKIHKPSSSTCSKNRKCLHENCTRLALYGYLNCYEYCKIHKKHGMIRNKGRTCIFGNCHLTPSFNFYGEKYGIFCSSHKKSGMINVLSLKKVNFQARQSLEDNDKTI